MSVRVLLADDERLVRAGFRMLLKASVGSGVLQVRLRDPKRRADAERLLSRALKAPMHLDSDPAALSARVSDPDRVAAALAELSRAGVAVTDFTLGQPSLDEVFLALTGRPTKDDPTTEEDAA